MTNEVTTLGYVLNNPERFDSGHYLYLPFGDVWQLNTNCAILPDSGLEGVPAIATANELSYAIGVAAVQDIVVNAKAQVEQVSADQLLEAFLFYYDRDAFIQLDCK
jgi:hypothetical protein